MSTYKGNDDCTDIILDLIAEHESNGNYNAVIGEIHARDDLGNYTIDQIFTLQARLLARGRPSTAVGRYQIIRRTLQTLVTELNFDSGTHFTPKVQDDMAVRLMVGRGYQDWWKGHMSDAEFAHGLSCEWASLPDPNAGGKSHYDGVGPNHAGTTLAHVYDGLRRAKAAIRK